MWDKEVVFLSAVAAKGARSVSGDVWEDAILLMKRVKDGLGNPLKLIATVTDMTQQSNEVRITPFITDTCDGTHDYICLGPHGFCDPSQPATRSTYPNLYKLFDLL